MYSFKKLSEFLKKAIFGEVINPDFAPFEAGTIKSTCINHERVIYPQPVTYNELKTKLKKNTKIMIIDTKTLKEWREYRKHGTITEIMREFKISRVALTNAFIHGRASAHTIASINLYFKTKKNEFDKLEKQKPKF